jgi:hypothetical protein
MAANTAPIFTLAPVVQWSPTTVSTSNATTDLTSGTSYLIFSASIDGGFVQRVRFRALGTNVATVGRLWINNGATTGSAANNTLIDEITLNATTAAAAASLANQEVPVNFALPTGYRLFVTLGTTVAAGFDVTAIGGRY